MKGLAQLEHHVVGDVHYGVDWTQSRPTKSLPHPQWGDSISRNITNDPPGETWAGLLGSQFDTQVVLDASGYGFGFGLLEHCTAARGCFTGHAKHTEAVAPVWGQIDIEDHIVEPKVFTDRRPNGSVGIQFEEARNVVAEPQFSCRAKHAFRSDSSKLYSLNLSAVRELRPDGRERRFEATGDVWRSTYDGMRFHTVRDGT